MPRTSHSTGRPPSSEGGFAAGPRDIPLRRWGSIARHTSQRIKQDNLSVVAAGAAFWFLLGLVPALAAGLAIYGLVADPATLQEQIASWSFLPQEARGIVESQLTRLATENTLAGWSALLGLAFALWSGSKGVKALILSLNIVYRTDEERGFLKFNRAALLLTLASILLGIFSLLLVVGVSGYLAIADLPPVLEWVLQVTGWLLLLGLFWGELMMLFRMGPDRPRPSWRWVTPGALLATLLWLAASILFSLYVGQFASYHETYGSLGAVVILMMWLYLTAFSILLGAELNALAEREGGQRDPVEGPAPAGPRG